MTKIIPLIIAALCSAVVAAQPSTEVYLFDLVKSESGYVLKNPINISDNEGYDNQPSFLVDGSGIFFSSTRNGQTDIALYEIESDKSQFLNNTSTLSEYSPVQTPDRSGISFIILSEDGTQQFWKVSPSQSEPNIIESEVVIGYYVWYTNDIYFCFVLPEGDNPSTLQKHVISTGEREILATNPGRSLHKIPGKDAISFIDKNDAVWKIKEYNPKTKEYNFLGNTLQESEDMVWLNEHTILTGKDEKLYSLNTKSDKNEWKVLADLSKFNLTGITRLAYHDGKLAVVVEGK